MKKISKGNLIDLVALMAENQQVYLPVKANGETNYARYTAGAEVDIDTLKTVKSAKEVFFPQSETLYTVVTEDKKYKITQQELQKEEFVLFGVRPCDVKGIEVLDRVFLTDPVDTFYKARRDHGVIVSFACSEPEESCFCKVFGIDCAEPNADVACWVKDGEIFWKALTAKGEALTEKCASVLADADETAVDTLKSDIRNIVEKLPYMNLSLEGWNGEVTDEKFNSEIWETLYKPCLACGTCTFVCPTCQCYDIKDYKTSNGIQ